MYQNEIIHFTGGINEYIGELDQTEHPLGEGWIRIKNPCEVIYGEKKGQGKVRLLLRIWGVKKDYRRFVDIYCPPDSLKEIRVLDKDGEVYKVYKRELDRPSLDLIKAPTDADLATIGKDRKLN